MNLEEFKKQLEFDLLITKWNPTDLQLQKIKDRISSLTQANKNDISIVIHEVYGKYECITMEGIDNTDLKTLLKLASK